MSYKEKWIWENIYLLDSHDMQMDLVQGNHCFLIGHHVELPSTINETSTKLVEGGFRYFNIFGEYAHLWEETISMKAGPGATLEIEANTVDREEMSYTLATLATLKPEAINFVLSDDYCFSEYLLEDLHDIFSGKARFSPYDWQRFRSGFEFKVHGKDAIISVYNGVVVGFLGEEMTFDTIEKGFRYKLFDGKNFKEIWEEIQDK